MGIIKVSDSDTVPDQSKKYISLKKASESVPYSQDYLSLRARQGRLKAIKKGRNWVTTDEWLREYIISISWENKRSSFQAENGLMCPRSKSAVKFELSKIIHQKTPAYVTWLAGLVLLISAGVLTASHQTTFKTAFLRLSDTLNTKLYPFYSNADHDFILEELEPFDRVGQIAGQTTTAVANPNKISFFTNLIAAFQIKARYALKTLIFWAKVSLNDYRVFFIHMGNILESWFINEKTELLTWPSENIVKLPKHVARDEVVTNDNGNAVRPVKGVVVAPAEHEDELKKEIAAAFSDEVNIELDETGASGIIKPIFREPSEQAYFYMLVPIDQESDKNEL